jgi:hypothetical protein
MVTEPWQLGLGSKQCPQVPSGRNSPGGMREEGVLASLALLSHEETCSSVFVIEGGADVIGRHGSQLENLPTHAGMFFYFSC